MNFFTNSHDVSSFIDNTGILLHYTAGKTPFQLFFNSVEDALNQLKFKYIRDVTGDRIIEYFYKQNT